MAITPCLILVLVVGRRGLSGALNTSQVLLSLLLPFVSSPLIYFTCNKKRKKYCVFKSIQIMVILIPTIVYTQTFKLVQLVMVQINIISHIPHSYKILVLISILNCMRWTSRIKQNMITVAAKFQSIRIWVITWLLLYYEY